MRQRTYYTATRARHYESNWHNFTERMYAPVIAMARAVLSPGQRVLDIGCGTGQLLATLYHMQPELHLTGIDGSAAMLQQAQLQLDHQARLIQATIQSGSDLSTALGDERFHLIIATNVLHYFADPLAVMAASTHLLAPNGKILLTDFVRHGWWWPVFERGIRQIDPAHCATLTVNEIAAALVSAGLAIDTVQPVKIDRIWHGVFFAAHLP